MRLALHAVLMLPALMLPALVHGQDTRWQIPVRGVVEFDRTTTNFELRPQTTADTDVEPLVRAGRDGGQTWRYREYLQQPPSAGWQSAGFDDSAWAASTSGFGGEPGKNPRHRSEWTKPHICLRVTFPTPKAKPKALVLTLCHDDDVEVWLNGTLLLREKGYVEYRHHVLEAKLLETLAKGNNVLAVHCTNTGGAQFVDVGLTAFKRTLPEAAYRQALGETTGDAETVRSTLFPMAQTPALLFQGELDARQQFVEQMPRDLRDVPGWLAVDLRALGSERSLRLTVPMVVGLGDLTITGKIPALSLSQRQTFRLAIQSSEAIGHEYGKRYAERHLEPHRRHLFSGQVEIERTIDPTAGVAEFETRLLGDVTNKDGTGDALRLSLAQRWRKHRTRDNRDPEFRAAVRKAIDHGSAWLRDGIVGAKDKRTDGLVENHRSYGTGRLALALLAIVKGNPPDDHAAVREGFAELRRREIVDTYSLANALMAIDALHTPATERDDLLQGRLAAPRIRALPAEDQDAVQRWTKQILANVDSRVDTAYLLRFSYVSEARFDHSVNQYGLLGLYSAQLCGYEVSPTHWRAAANHWLLLQEKPGKPQRLQLVSHRATDEVAPPARTVAASSASAPAGWGYINPRAEDSVPEPITGAMTTAGITGLALCRSGLLGLGIAKDPLLAKIDAAVRSGFAWVATHFTVRGHSEHPLWTHHYYYYLYGLERACELEQIAWLNGRDWYFEGAMLLLASQNANGSWPGDPAELDIECSAMAVLFLKKAAPAVITR